MIRNLPFLIADSSVPDSFSAKTASQAARTCKTLSFCKWVLIMCWALVFVPGILNAAPPDTPASYSPLRLAEALLPDLRHHAALPESFRLLLTRFERDNDLLRLIFSGRNDGGGGLLKPVAIYEFHLPNGRIVRRDLTPLSINFPFVSAESRVPNHHLADVSTGGLTIRGVLRNLPGYILETSDYKSRFSIWAESNGMMVASNAQLIGTTMYELRGVPVTAGRVVIKAAIRGYDLATLHPGVALNPAHPIGTVSGIDVDFHSMRPITRDVRLLIRSNGGGSDSSFPTGARARVYCKETGHSAETTCGNGYGEALLSEVPTGWPLNFSAINLNSGWFSGSLGPVTIPENGGSQFTEIITLE